VVRCTQGVTELRVLLIHNLKRGGAWRRMQEQASRLDADVVELTLGTGVPVLERSTVISYRPSAPSRPRSLRPPFRYADTAGLLYAWRKLSHRANALNGDVIFANPCQFLQSPMSLLTTKAPTLYFCDEPRRVDHEASVAASRNPATRGIYGPLYAAERRLDSAAVARARRVVTNSAFTAGRVHAAYGVEATPVPMGVSELFRQARPPVQREDVVLSVGMLTANKGHDLVIRAAGTSATARRVRIVSPRPDEGVAAELNALAQGAGVQLEILVGISDDELRAQYDRCRLTAYMARSEPLGLASLEAQACGAPVVVADEGGLPETMVDGVTGFKVKREATAVAEAFDRLADGALAARMGAAAAAHVEGATWDRSASIMAEHLRELAGTRG
jgi:glycosyltransferase involved in cell wall biosynthesis